MEEKNKIFARKNLYMILAVVGLVAVLVAVIIAIASTSGREGADTSTSVSTSKTTSEQTSASSSSTSSSSSQSASTSEKPTDYEIIFTVPVQGGYVINEFTAASVIFNNTLGIYTGHMGIDFGGEEGAYVLAAFKGTIDSIESTYLQGTTIVIDHGNGLMTVYNSIDALEDLAVGQLVEQGDVLGVISTNNRQEYKDGAHLHFEVLENNKTIDPYKYLDIEGK